jgi:hypothetical protein
MHFQTILVTLATISISLLRSAPIPTKGASVAPPTGATTPVVSPAAYVFVLDFYSFEATSRKTAAAGKKHGFTSVRLHPSAMRELGEVECDEQFLYHECSLPCMSSFFTMNVLYHA